MDWIDWIGVALAVLLLPLIEIQRRRDLANVAALREAYANDMDLSAKYARVKALADMATNLESIVGICEPGQSEGLKLASQVCRNWAVASDEPAVNETNAL